MNEVDVKAIIAQRMQTFREFEKAAEEEKPVFLSIGYSSCHWYGNHEKGCYARFYRGGGFGS